MKRTGSTTRSSLRTAAAVLLAAAAVALVSLSAGSCAVARKPQPPSLPQPSSQPSPMPGPAPVTTTTTIITATTTTTVGTPVPALPDKAAAAERKYAPFFAADSRLVALGAKREPLSSGDMVRASLVMSGASPSALPGYESRLASLLRTVADGSTGAKTEGARAEAALTKLHTLVFHSYSEYASSITGVLDTGVYNCLSSALFYHFALRTMGIESKGVETVDHAFCLVRADGREIDVETTTVYGFDPGTKKEFTDVFSKKSGYTYVPPGDYARRKTIGDKAFLGLLASNFVAEAEKKAPSEASDPEGALRTATEALKHALDGYAIRNDAEGRALLDGRIGNFVVVLFAAKRWDDAAGFVAAAEKALGADAATSSLRVKAGYNLSISLNERSDEEGALRAAAWARIPQAANASLAASSGPPSAQLPDPATAARNALRSLASEALADRDFARVRRAVSEWGYLVQAADRTEFLSRAADAEIFASLDSKPYRETLAMVDAALAAGLITSPRADEFRAHLYSGEADRLAVSGDWLGAATIADEGARKAPSRTELGSVAATYRHNFAVSRHNLFVDLYNARRYAEAKASVEEALRLLPGDSMLAADLAAAKKALGLH